MQALSNVARFILDRMEPDRPYETSDLRALVRHASAEQLRELMHELWVNRQVERVGYSGWRRRRSAPPHKTQVDAPLDTGDAAAASTVRRSRIVKPEELFDHEAFTDFFR
jgi:hypothetical protein